MGVGESTPARPEPAADLFSEQEIDDAVMALRRDSPALSAFGVLSMPQRILFVAIAMGVAAFAAYDHERVFLSINAALASYFIIALIYRAILMGAAPETKASSKPLSPDSLCELPVVTILAPLYHDAASLSGLAAAIDALDYPVEKKDVKLLLEADDSETLRQATQLGLTDRYEVITVPAIGPKTKPKACNFGLARARGKFTVIYDAEDQPETDQLQKAVAAFAADGGDSKLACLQARLNYFNADENWLTRLFALEYALWFDWLLPALQRFGAPIPLGGTSNFFRTDILRQVGGWDPYNVTEDADLGMRLARLGYRVEMLDSTTYEEANCRLGNWVRQRSRWIKGHLQTWLVHMRAPITFARATGWPGLLSMQLFLAGNVASALFNPILWTAFIILTITGPHDFMPPWLIYLNIGALVFGNFCFIAFAVMAPLRRGWRHLCLYAVTAPAYWLLTSVAAYKALWQIAVNPYYWEKTDHMISAFKAPIAQSPIAAPAS